MTWVKICGITNLEDALMAVDAGADALGFVFYDSSPRRLTPDAARHIIEHLPEHVDKVGVNVFSETSVGMVRNTGLTALQHHFRLATVPSDDGTKAMGLSATAFGQPIKVFVSFPANFLLEDEERIKDIATSFSRMRVRAPGQPPIPEGVFDTFFFDSGSTDQPGGTGRTFDWSRAVPIAEGMRQGGLKLVVAGGLTPENVAEPMQILRPWGVDVSSGVEASPGKKDPEKVRAFIRAVREADKANSN